MYRIGGRTERGGMSGLIEHRSNVRTNERVNKNEKLRGTEKEGNVCKNKLGI